jgi:hypothetical protein
MKNCSLIILLVITCWCLSPSVFAQYKSMDIALEGPWILYEEQQFKSKATDSTPVYVSVLIAVSPLGAAANQVGHHDSKHHHVPQMSTGEGYYIKKKGIFCLTFGNTCYPQANGQSLIPDAGYPNNGYILQEYYGAPGDKTWPWQTQGATNTVLILPMPDSYHNDGVWPFRFRKYYELASSPTSEQNASIGIVLHYSKGLGTVSLYECDLNQPSSDNCTKPVLDPNNNQVSLTNTGTLRLQMRAPDNEDACDHHVRRGYHEMFTIFSSPRNQDYAFIEPARGIYANGSIEFESANDHPCWTRDKKQHDQDRVSKDELPAPAPGNKTIVTFPNIDPMNWSPTYVGLLTRLRDQINELVVRKGGLQILDTARKDITDAINIAQSPFPRLSDMRRVDSLPNDAANSIEAVLSNKENGIGVRVRAKLLLIAKGLRSRVASGPGKNGADCRAPMVLLRLNAEN